MAFVYAVDIVGGAVVVVERPFTAVLIIILLLVLVVLVGTIDGVSDTYVEGAFETIS